LTQQSTPKEIKLKFLSPQKSSISPGISATASLQTGDLFPHQRTSDALQHPFNTLQHEFRIDPQNAATHCSTQQHAAIQQ